MPSFLFFLPDRCLSLCIAVTDLLHSAALFAQNQKQKIWSHNA